MIDIFCVCHTLVTFRFTNYGQPVLFYDFPKMVSVKITNTETVALSETQFHDRYTFLSSYWTLLEDGHDVPQWPSVQLVAKR